MSSTTLVLAFGLGRCGFLAADEDEKTVWFEQPAARNEDELIADGLSRFMTEHRVSGLKQLIIPEGPGGFTSLRIGCAFAFGFAQSRGLSVVQVPLFPAIAHSLSSSEAVSERGASEITVQAPAGGSLFFQQSFSLPVSEPTSPLLCRPVDQESEGLRYTLPAEELLQRGRDPLQVHLNQCTALYRYWRLAEKRFESAKGAGLGALKPSFIRPVNAKKIQER